MANTKISDLPAVTDVIGTDEYVLARSGTSKKIAASDLLVADAVAFTPTGTIAATDVQAAIEEVATEVGRAYVLLRDEQTSGTDGGTATSGSFATRTLNTEVSDTDGVCSLSSNQITLAAGIYECTISAPTWRTSRHQIRLQNVTDATTVLVGTSEYSGNQDAGGVFGPMTRSVVMGRFTVAASKALEVQHRVEVTKATNGLGVATGWGTEVYAVAEFRKVA